MNFKNQAGKLERFLEDEFKKKTPLLVMPDKTIIYKKYKIYSKTEEKRNNQKKRVFYFILETRD